MAIKQLELYSAEMAQKNLEVLKNQDPETDKWNRTEETIALTVKRLESHIEMVRNQERELSDAIEDGWSVYSSYPIGTNIQGVRIVLHKRSS